MCVVGRSIKMRWLYDSLCLGDCMALVFLFTRIPSSFIPEEDQGILMTLVQLPPVVPKIKRKRLWKRSTPIIKPRKDLVESVFMVQWL